MRWFGKRCCTLRCNAGDRGLTGKGTDESGRLGFGRAAFLVSGEQTGFDRRPLRVMLGEWGRPMGVVRYSLEMRVGVLYFAVLKDVFGREREELELPAGATVSGLLELLREREVSGVTGRFWDSIAVAVNQEYARADAVLEDGDEVALLPPVSGGCKGLRT
jgi:molybdopterin converting factor subunit 1